MKIRKAHLLALLLCGTLTLSGCGDNGNAQANTSSPTQQPPSPKPSVPTNAPDSTESPRPTEENSIAAQIANMTLDEKIGQMLLVGIEGTTLDESARRMISEDKVGGIILYADNISNLQGMVKLINNLKKINVENSIPLFVSVDQEGGKVSRMPKEFVSIPSNKKVGDTNNAKLAYTMGELLGRELTLTGFNMDFAPVLDINSNSQNPIIGDRSFGSSASRVTKMGLAEIKGLRSEKMIPVVKHYPGHGDTSVDSHLELPVVNKTARQLAELEWIPFQAAIKDKVEAVMVAHILFPKLDPDKPASLSKVIIGEQLRGDMGYEGVVITDDLTMGAIVKHFNLGTAAVDTIKAGSDILLIAHGYDNEKLVFNKIKQSVKNGTISEARINESVQRILTLKSNYHLSDKETVPAPDLTALNQDIRAWRQQVEK
ncbi:beta-N-acetylhexosaminidase [Paenibacillus wynnii]|uniref:Glycoside hydrolase family 3 n=1 Tax=Paenibacillus wynnii TaxID=268407 RepID=A0A098M3P5_9BACL|nr:beta-N-acetylhexosaminidase [Paenibacillus wynnii]KGE17154.1 glycoside hydrolase family 3 [Paenibacillus wynnii]